MKLQRTLAPLALGLVAAVAYADGVGSRVTEADLEDWAKTEAQSFEDFTGRAILIEFFAYW